MGQQTKLLYKQESSKSKTEKKNLNLSYDIETVTFN